MEQPTVVYRFLFGHEEGEKEEEVCVWMCVCVCGVKALEPLAWVQIRSCSESSRILLNTNE